MEESNLPKIKKWIGIDLVKGIWYLLYGIESHINAIRYGVWPHIKPCIKKKGNHIVVVVWPYKKALHLITCHKSYIIWLIPCYNMPLPIFIVTRSYLWIFKPYIIVLNVDSSHNIIFYMVIILIKRRAPHYVCHVG
jgi:hypothetical protein